jgi:hypothetical protein
MQQDVIVLQTLVAALDAARPFDAPTVGVRIHGPVGEPRRIDHHLRLDRLVGYVAPSGCSAVGAVAGGWAVPTSGARGRERIRTTVLVGRDGMVAARIRWASGQVVDEPPGSGRLLDCLRRAFALATDPPAVGTDVLFASMWLAALAGGARDARAPTTWSQAAALHPAVCLLAGSDAGPPTRWLPDAARALVVACPWSEVRRMIRDGLWRDSDIPVRAAEWMDDGMLSRWLLDGRPSLADQLNEVSAQLPVGIATRVRQTLRTLGLAPRAGGQ